MLLQSHCFSSMMDCPSFLPTLKCVVISVLTLNDLEGHSPVPDLFKRTPSNINLCSILPDFSQQLARAVPRRQLGCFVNKATTRMTTNNCDGKHVANDIIPNNSTTKTTCTHLQNYIGDLLSDGSNRHDPTRHMCASNLLQLWSLCQRDVQLYQAVSVRHTCCSDTERERCPQFLCKCCPQPTAPLLIVPCCICASQIYFHQLNCQSSTPNQLWHLPCYCFQADFPTVIQPICNCVGA